MSYFVPYLHSEGFNVVGTVRSPREIGQVELDLIPSVIKTHRHGTNERFYTGCTLVVGSSESSSDVLVV